MKIALAQINTTVGDVAGNLLRARDAVERAGAAGADLVALPELALSGYPPLDLVERVPFIDANEAAVHELAESAQGIYVLVGHVAHAEADHGKHAANAASLLRDGRLIARRDKMLLPTYDVFDESRYFQPPPANEPVELDGASLGLTVCEDAWNDATFWEHPLYRRDPVAELAAAGAELILNISASPFSVGRQSLRRAMLANAARRHGVRIFYVNLVGGNDQLIFDGRSLALDPEGRIVAEGAAFKEDLLMVDAAAAGSAQPPPEMEDVEEVWRALKLGLADYARKCGFTRAVLGLSGGIDSALTAVIAAEALGAPNVTALFMPSEFSSQRSAEDAREVAARLGIRLHELSIEEARTRTEELLGPIFEGTERGTAEENIQARIRGNLIMAYANKFGCLPLATGNKSELAVGYCTLYGDMVGGLAVIGDVPKTMVYRLARHANREREVIPQSTIERPPSAELKADQTDQDVLPPYEVLDPILNLYIERNLERDEIVARGHDAETVSRVLAMVDRAEFKRRQAPITLRVTAKAFGPGRRLPVAQNWPR